MLRHYLKTPPLKKILQFQDKISFFLLKNNYSLASEWWENTKPSFKENARTFSKNSISQENIRISKLKEDYKTYTKKKISNQKLNQWLKNLEDELYQLQNKQAKGAKHGSNIR